MKCPEVSLAGTQEQFGPVLGGTQLNLNLSCRVQPEQLVAMNSKTSVRFPRCRGGTGMSSCATRSEAASILLEASRSYTSQRISTSPWERGRNNLFTRGAADHTLSHKHRFLQWSLLSNKISIVHIDKGDVFIGRPYH